VAPVLLFDGDCGLCSSLARFATARLRPAGHGAESYAVLPYQDYDLASVGLAEAQCTEALQWVDERGHSRSAQDAVARLLLASRWWARPAGALLLAPGVHAVAGAAYRWVSRNRHRLPGGTPACAPDQDPASA
jgi:predicted DCC family thiol-disulfide oxidoreductase YuxK